MRFSWTSRSAFLRQTESNQLRLGAHTTDGENDVLLVLCKIGHGGTHDILRQRDLGDQLWFKFCQLALGLFAKRPQVTLGPDVQRIVDHRRGGIYPFPEFIARHHLKLVSTRQHKDRASLGRYDDAIAH